jgi:hypothetical protein
VFAEGYKRVNLDISNNVKRYQLLYTNQPSSSQDLSVEEYTAELIKKKGAPLESY